MIRENLIADLKEFGLSEYEAKAYLALTIHGPLPASSLCNFSKIPQSKIYNVLKALVEKCLAEYWDGKPLKFRAAEPVIALNKMLERKRLVISNLKEKSNSILNELKPLRQTDFKNEGFGLWSSKGRRACLEKAAEMISRAKQFGFAITSSFSRYPSLDDACLSALKKGIKIKMLGTSDLNEAGLARTKWYVKQGADIRILPMNIHPTIGLIDDKEVCVKLDNNAYESDVIWSNNPALINVFKTYFDELWTRAKKFKSAF
jgi:sugar-specific transcriptional regulator TrmB